jgi:MoaA/NifB/PqqE/SkfB family radical SAM enzyme
MCCNSSGEVKGKTLTIPEIDVILKRVKEKKSITSLGITGGEPMLFPDLIEYILDFDFERKIKITLKTNGFWGGSLEKYEYLLNRATSKLAFVSFSYDEFHKEFIDVKNIRKAVEYLYRIKIQTDLVGCFLKNSTSPADILDDIGESAFFTNFLYQPVVKTGGAGLIFGDDKFIKIVDLDYDRETIRCIAPARKDLLVDSNLDVYPCCSQVVQNTILRIGNVRDMSFDELENVLANNKIFYTMFSKGFKPFLDYMDIHKIDYPHKLSSPCEICGFLFSSEWFLNEILENNMGLL